MYIYSFKKKNTILIEHFDIVVK